MTRKIQKNNEKSNKTVKNMKKSNKTVKKKPSMTRRKGGKKVKKQTRRTNMKKRVTRKRGGQNITSQKMPPRGDLTAQEYMTAIQKFHKTRAETTFKPNSPENDGSLDPLDMPYTNVCTNIVDKNKNRNELDDNIVNNKNNIIFELDNKYFCYDVETVRKIISNIDYIQVKWNMRPDVDKSTLSKEELENGYGREGVLQNMDEFETYIKGNTFMADKVRRSDYIVVSGLEDNKRLKYAKECLVWLFPMAGRVALSEFAVSLINRYQAKNVIFKLKKQPKQTIIGNLFNVFGVSMVHGHEPGEYVYDIEVISRTSDSIANEDIKKLKNPTPVRTVQSLVKANDLVEQYKLKNYNDDDLILDDNNIIYIKTSATSVAFSPDGKSVVSGHRDNTVSIWDVASGAELTKMEGHGATVLAVAFSPDGKSVVSGSFDMTMRIWDVASGAELAKMERHDGGVAFSPDGKSVASGSEHENTVRIWDVASGAELAKMEGHVDHVRSMAFSPDGKSMVSGSWDKTVRIWDVASGAELAKIYAGKVNSVAFSPDGKSVVSGSMDNTVRIIDVASGAKVKMEGHDCDVTSVAFSPDGKSVVSGSWDETVRIWDVASGAELAKLEGHGGRVNSVAFSPDGKSVVSGSEDETVRIWDI